MTPITLYYIIVIGDYHPRVEPYLSRPEAETAIDEYSDEGFGYHGMSAHRLETWEGSYHHTVAVVNSKQSSVAVGPVRIPVGVGSDDMELTIRPTEDGRFTVSCARRRVKVLGGNPRDGVVWDAFPDVDVKLY